MKTKGKLWGGRFKKTTDESVEKFTESISFDRRLYKQDIRGSIAHAEMLARQGIISARDCARIVSGLKAIQREIEAGKFKFMQEHEDIHMNIEAELIRRTGGAGKKLHTGRSRNDQVALDMRMYVMDEAGEVKAGLKYLLAALLAAGRKNMGVVMPGYTHLQHAQPVLFSHHMMAYFEMFSRDFGRFTRAGEAASVMPLGSGALAGSGLKLDRGYVARRLGFREISANSMDAVSDRDFLLDFCGACATCMMHLSRMCEELVLWSSEEFGFIALDETYTTGSSMMPQKRNPDAAELTRAKTGRVYGNLVGLLTVMKGLPLAYNRDLQEDKESAFDTADTVKACIAIASGMISTMRTKPERMAGGLKRGHIFATDLADFLVGKGMPFRDAHRAVGTAVAYCEEKGIQLTEISLEELKKISGLFDRTALRLMDPAASVGTKTLPGGTSRKSVSAAMREATARLRRLK
jgi:argininosuccinate lyase